MKIIVVLLLFVLLAATPAGATALAPEPVITRGLEFVQIWNPDASETHFRYLLRSGGPPAISHIEIDICEARLLRVLVETPDGVTVERKPGLVKIETATMGDNETKIITLVMDGSPWTARPTTYRWKAGNTAPVEAETYGPLCTATAVKLTSFSASQPWSQLWTNLLALFR